MHTFAGLGLGLVGCAPMVGETTFVRELEQVGVVPAPSGPRATGPFPEAGTVGVEGAASVGVQGLPAETRRDGAPGSLAAQDWGRLRVMWGATPGFEAGALLEVSPGSLAQPLAKDLPRGSEIEDVLGRLGTSARLRAPVAPDLYFGMVGEAEVAFVSYTRTETLSIVDTRWKRGEDDERIESTTEYSSTHDDADSVPVITARVGPTLAWDPVERASFTAGVLLQEAPLLYGYDSATWTCTAYAGGDRACEDEPEYPSDTYDAWVGTAFLAIAVPVERVTLWAQGYAHVGGDADWMRGAPGGVDAGVRWTSKRRPRWRR